MDDGPDQKARDVDYPLLVKGQKRFGGEVGWVGHAGASLRSVAGIAPGHSEPRFYAGCRESFRQKQCLEQDPLRHVAQGVC